MRPSPPSPWRQTLRTFKHRWYDYHWLVVGLLGLVALVLGIFGFGRYYKWDRSFWDLLHLSFQLFVLESGGVKIKTFNPALEIARLLAPLVAGYTVLQGLLIIFREQVQVFQLGFCRDHVIICGLGRKGTRLAEEFLDQGDRVVLIEKNSGNPQVNLFREKGALVLVGDAKDPHLLTKARVDRAKHLLCVCSEDDTNAEVTLAARELVPISSHHLLTCVVHIVDPELHRLLRQMEFEAPGTLGFRLALFNVFERGARAFFKRYLLLESPLVQGDGRAPHLMIIGLGRLGETLAAHAARTWWLNRKDHSPRLRLTLVDKAAESKSSALELRYPRLKDACEVQTCSLEVPSPDLLAAAQQFASVDVNEEKAVIVCLEDDSLALPMALDLAQHLSTRNTPIVVNLMENSGLMGLLYQAEGTGRYSNLRAFNVLDETCTPELVLGGTNEILARALHEAYIRQQQAKDIIPETNPIMVPWEKLREDFKEANRRAADDIARKFAAIGCDIITMEDWEATFSYSSAELEKLAEMEHDRWVEDKIRAGWHFAPGPKDPARKTTPCLVSWIELPEEEKEKDREQVQIYPSLLHHEGFQIIRVHHSAKD